MNATFIILAVTVVVSLYAFGQNDLMRKLIMNPYLVHNRNQYYRFFTSGIIHNDHMHLIFNMLALYFFGPIVEMVFNTVFGELGTVYYIVMYILAVVVSDVPSYFKHRNNPGYNSLGASGAVSAVVFAFILFLPLEKINLYYFIPIPGFMLGALYLIYSYYQGRKGGDNINHDAHIYGALFGVIFCVVLYPASIPHFFNEIKQFRFEHLFAAL
jgi:membrane associated rhomboid family serine protease